MTRGPPVESTKARLRDLIEGKLDVEDARSELVKLSVRRIVEEAMEAVTRDLLGRDHYERREGRSGYRNGYRASRLKTAEGLIDFAVPQVREADHSATSACEERSRGRQLMRKAPRDLQKERYAHTDDCKDLLNDLKRRRMSDPVLVATDGAAGWIRAVEECFPSTLRQRCLAHKKRNILAKLPSEAIGEFRAAVTAAYEAPTSAQARQMKADLVERLFGEERRRLRPAGQMFGERPVMKLMYAALIRAGASWRGIKITNFERHQLERLAEHLKQEHLEETKPITTTSSTPQTTYSKKRT